MNSSSHSYVNYELVCRPLESLGELQDFVENPPAWRTLCKELRPHSKEKLKNIEVNAQDGELHLENPRAFCHFDPTNQPVLRYHEDSLPRTLVCHDLANGYKDDSYLDGSSKWDAYTFYNWAGIDIFCYFSHHFVTVPPLGWINVAHAHGVKVIGTLVTEWAEGVQFWKVVLDSEAMMENLVSYLVAVAKTLKFDGWLLNIENKIFKVEQLLGFVSSLHRALHAELPHAVLIWYDSITVTGSLNWQNALNEKNKRFFDLCDGIFTNYSWTEDDIELSAKNAENRIRDVYIGIDVWGRNFYGGGQFNVQQAIKLVYQHGLSLAIFAPAWTYEGISHEFTRAKKDPDEIEMGSNLTFLGKFLLRDRALWDSMWPYLFTRVPCELPFQSSFCRGQGLKRRHYGETVSPGGWYNLRHMQYQPNALHGPHSYLLSTKQNLKAITTAASKQENKDNVPHLRESLYTMQNIKRLSTASTDTKIAELKEADEAQHPSGQQEQSPANPTMLERKGKFDFVKNLFKKKHPSEDIRPLHSSPNSPSDIATKSSGRSMTTMSISLRLGHSFKVTRLGLAYVADELDCLEIFFDDSFLGGACLKINARDIESPAERWIRLFYTDFHCSESLIACVVTKNIHGYDNQSLNVVMRGGRAGRQEQVVANLLGRELPQTPYDAKTLNVAFSPVNPETPQFQSLQRYMVMHEPGFYVPIENIYGWKVRYYEVNMPGMNIRSVNLHATHDDGGPILLGYFGICAWDKQRTLNPVSST